ncbi:ThiF family protein [Promicromonospora sp. AC04]|uniref:ThiF family adenylyltransferase n=1 Tax=Promicromonospora sp. AC04 TaxID=2135723 RepID=UPI000D36ABAB|nr:ThiF family adenylyltransferase [Promicromonospora sp. AC04]PUB27687.1 ThiF family protein [Promicromonospora sp. AC04]
MSRPPFAPEEAIEQLQSEGFNIEVVEGAVLIHDVPAVDPNGTVHRVTLGDPLQYAGDRLLPPRDHTLKFCGDHPSDDQGHPLTRLVAGPDHSALTPGVVAQFLLSSKPTNGTYLDLHDKVTHYVDLIERWAQSIEPGASARTFGRTDGSTAHKSPFRYADSATPRAGITDLAEPLQGQRLAIVGIGGTGSYLLDLLMKTPVAEIHLYDGDVLLSHNAFRAPRAISVEELRTEPNKASYWAKQTEVFREGVVAHDLYVTAEDVPELAQYDFVFLAVDDGPARTELVTALEAADVSFIDVGLGVDRAGPKGQLLAAVRISVSTPQARAHIPVGTGKDEYGSNIQIAELNALNATLAVLAWKRLNGYYLDAVEGTTSIYSTDDNTIAEDRP